MTTIKTQVSVKSSGDGVEEESEWKTTLITNSIGGAAGPVRYLLATGVNSIAVPTGSKAMTIQPPESSLAVLRLPGVSGSTGMALRTGHASMNPIATGASSVLVDTNREELVYIHWG